MLSCGRNACTMGFDLYAFTSNNKTELICRFNETNRTKAVGVTLKVKCSSTTFYSSFVLQQTKLNADSNYVFGLWYYEIFGDLYDINTHKIQPCTCRVIGYGSNLFLYLYVFITMDDETS